MSDLIRWELIQNAGNELVRVITGTKSSLETQNVGIRNILNSFSNLTGVLKLIDGNIVQINQVITETASRNKTCANEVLSTTRAMKELETRFQSVQSLLRTIDAVANQTNLLALNATIEAARAGDAGKGFAVVAGEVKELSKNTQKVNNEIQETIKIVWESITQLSKQLGDVHALMNQAVTASEQSRSSAEAIVQSSRQMQGGIQSTTQELGNIDRSIQSTGIQLNEVSVIGQTFENLMKLLKFLGVFEKLNDPLERLGPIVSASTYMNESRFLQTDGEVKLKEDDVLISITDPRGVIKFANKTFCDIAGYKNEELIGIPHNIVRHPDMPKTAFADLWAVLESKQLWQGYVKNKTKSGGFYWVKATAFPCLGAGGVITGYISVRFKPPMEAILRATDAYRRLP